MKTAYMVIGCPGSGKCMDPETKILMFEGSIKLTKDIKAGDKLMGPDSSPRTVLSTCSGREEMFEVVPVKGEKWKCNKSHILSLKMSSNSGHSYRRGQVFNLSIDEYLAKNDRFKHHAKLWRTGVDFPGRNVSVDPYWVGLWLGDGTVVRPDITKDDPEIADYLKAYAKENGLTVKDVSSGNKCTTWSFSGGNKRNFLLPFIRTCFVDGQKRIPSDYLINSREKRLLLLAGLLDTDGYCSVGGYEIITKFPGLKDDILYLARSLGFAAYVSPKKGTIKKTGFIGSYFRIYISGDMSVVPCRIKRKIADKRRQIKDVLVTGFKLNSIGEGQYCGFGLDGDHLYLLGALVRNNSPLVIDLEKQFSTHTLDKINQTVHILLSNDVNFHIPE